MLYTSAEMEERAALSAAAAMCTAARTATKAHGKDTIRTLVLTGEDKEKLACRMEEVGQRLMGGKSPTWYGRDAANVRASQAVVLIGAELRPRGVPNCGSCGFEDCAACTAAGGRCAFTFVDLGIAVASAAETAADRKCDNRIMYSIGRAAPELEGVDGSCFWLGIPVFIGGKSVFFDRGVFHD